jgi:hypothetical protein
MVFSKSFCFCERFHEKFLFSRKFSFSSMFLQILLCSRIVRQKHPLVFRIWIHIQLAPGSWIRISNGKFSQAFFARKAKKTFCKISPKIQHENFRSNPSQLPLPLRATGSETGLTGFRRKGGGGHNSLIEKTEAIL